MEVITLQMGRRRLAERDGILLLDTTFMTGKEIFAPTKQMVYAHKDYVAGRGDYDDEAYTIDYKRRMIRSWNNNRDEWLAVIKKPSVLWGVACYCPPGCFCHRHLLTGYFKEICGKLDLPFEYYGEYQ